MPTMSLQYRVSEEDLKRINGHLLDMYDILEGILLNPMVQPDSNGASSVGNASHASSASSSNRKAETGRLQSAKRTRKEVLPVNEPVKVWTYRPGEFAVEFQPDKINVFTHATLKKVKDERLYFLAGHSGNIIGYLVYSDPNPANKNLWHVALRCEICHKEEWKTWYFRQNRKDAIFPWHVTKNNNDGYV